jgi:Fic family protein
MIRREAVSTSALEGTHAPAADVFGSEIDQERPRSLAVVEVLNFIRATEEGLNRLADLPVCVRLAKELQATLVKGTSSEDYQAGNVRNTQVIIGPYKGCSVLEAHYVPPPPGLDLDLGLDAWERWIHGDHEMHTILRVALAHYQFEALHPFTDSNGRIGRLLAILQLVEYGTLSAPLINLSPFFEARSDQYRHLLREVSTRGAFDEWVQFFCACLVAQAKDAEQRIRDLLAWRTTALDDLKRSKVKGVSLEVVNMMIEYPVVSVQHIAAMHGVSNQAANNAVNRLMEHGILVETTGRPVYRLFSAPAVMNIFFRPSSNTSTSASQVS